jgi:hypothetical protein
MLRNRLGHLAPARIANANEQDFGAHNHSIFPGGSSHAIRMARIPAALKDGIANPVEQASACLVLRFVQAEKQTG